MVRGAATAAFAGHRKRELSSSLELQTRSRENYQWRESKVSNVTPLVYFLQQLPTSETAQTVTN